MTMKQNRRGGGGGGLILGISEKVGLGCGGLGCYKFVTLSAKTSLMQGVHKAGFRREGHIC